MFNCHGICVEDLHWWFGLQVKKYHCACSRRSLEMCCAEPLQGVKVNIIGMHSLCSHKNRMPPCLLCEAACLQYLAVYIFSSALSG